jgi:hypothetical protein
LRLSATLQWRGLQGEWAFGFAFIPWLGFRIELGPLAVGAGVNVLNWEAVGLQVSYFPRSRYATIYAFAFDHQAAYDFDVGRRR